MVNILSMPAPDTISEVQPASIAMQTEADGNRQFQPGSNRTKQRKISSAFITQSAWLKLAVYVVCLALLVTGSVMNPIAAAEGKWSTSDGSDVSMGHPNFPNWRGLSPGERARLEVRWEEVRYGNLDHIELDGTRLLRWKSVPSQKRDLAKIGIVGRLLIRSDDGKSLRPVRTFYPVRVLISKDPGASPIWMARHSEKDTAWDETVIEEDGRFLAQFDRQALHRLIGKPGEYQVGLVLGTGDRNSLSWSINFPLLAGSQQLLKVIGSRPLTPIQQLINESPSPSADGFDPARLVACVNALHALGKERAIAELRGFLEIANDGRGHKNRHNIDHSDRECLFPILLLLFDPPKGERRKMPGLGQPAMLDLRAGVSGATAEKELFARPHFPIVLKHDYPFCIVTGYALGGFPEPPEWRLEWAEKRGILRSKPLSPSGDPLHAADDLASDFGWRQGQTALREQAERVKRAK